MARHCSCDGQPLRSLPQVASANHSRLTCRCFHLQATHVVEVEEVLGPMKPARFPRRLQTLSPAATPASRLGEPSQSTDVGSGSDIGGREGIDVLAPSRASPGS